MQALSFLLLTVFVTILAVDSYPQASRGISAAGRRVDDFDNQRTKAERDAMAREMRGKKPTKEELQNAARIKTETKEDLEGLQRSYNDIVVKLGAGTVPPEFIVQEAEKVNKFANRLKANIIFPKPESDQAKLVEMTGDSRKQLRELCTRIYDFLTNPVIENPQVLDLAAAAKARESLDSVIAISEKLKST